MIILKKNKVGKGIKEWDFVILRRMNNKGFFGSLYFIRNLKKVRVVGIESFR